MAWVPTRKAAAPCPEQLDYLVFYIGWLSHRSQKKWLYQMRVYSVTELRQGKKTVLLLEFFSNL